MSLPGEGEGTREVVLRSGRRVVVKLPPFTLEFSQEMQRSVAKTALVNPELMAILTVDEIMEIYVTASDLFMEYWTKKALSLSSGERLT